MRTFLNPIIKFMDGMQFPMKLCIIGVIATFAVAILSIQLVVQSLKIMDFSKKELTGVAVISPLFNIMRNIQLYRNLEDEYFLGNVSLKDQLLAMQDTIDQAINTMNNKEGDYIRNLELTEDWNSVKTEWELIKSNIIIDDTKSNVSTETHLIGSIQTLIIEACDSSNLTLDPNIDTYYLMDSSCTKIPFFVEKISEIRNMGIHALLAKKLTPDDKQKMIIYKTLLNVYIKPAIKTNYDKISSAIENKTSTPSEFRPYIETLYTQTGDLMTALDNTVLSDQYTVDPQHFSEQYLTLLSLTYKLNTLTDQKLYELINDRVRTTARDLYINITISIISLLALLYLFFGIYFSVINSIKKLVQGSNKLAGGDFNAAVTLSTQDELVLVASSFNIMLDSISRIDGEISRALASALKGDLSQRITGAYRGSFEKLKNYVNDTLDHINKLSKKIKIPASLIDTSVKKFSAYRELKKQFDQQIISLNKIASHMEQAHTLSRQNSGVVKQAAQGVQSIDHLAAQGDALTLELNDKLANLYETLQKMADRIFTEIDSYRASTSASDIKDLTHHAINEAVSTVKKIDEIMQCNREKLRAIKQTESVFPDIERRIEEQSYSIEKIVQELGNMNTLTDKDILLLEEVMATIQAIEMQVTKMNVALREFSATE